ncbi:ribosomal-protein-alanine N-acetyltransferase [Aquamicrobium lusatiense]|uniref:Ribosomal-protein-alanine N-acetyltransferase n=1 Tax=Aquamicrobium lusatiense TaxID=89772 RepID=A0A7W9S1D3_9HYPH|nr:N-acetyltransferase [Aquamicrobium lusatiense]MBB6012100.1 ribosomal-protein-alanine N-acetyltransferase [Aquamicrobium lusatiense]
MRIPFLSSLRREYALQPLSPEESGAAAALHREGFSRPWTDEEFISLLGQDTVFGFAARAVGRGRGDPVGFVLARLAAGEAEILTIVVARAHRRYGLGWQLMDAVLRELHARRAEALFLEVDETNPAAVGLYRRLGFLEVGKRPNYYQTPVQAPTSALVMRRDLRR